MFELESWCWYTDDRIACLVMTFVRWYLIKLLFTDCACYCFRYFHVVDSNHLKNTILSFVPSRKQRESFQHACHRGPNTHRENRHEGIRRRAQPNQTPILHEGIRRRAQPNQTPILQSWTDA
jgi:hypothetical protein